MYRRVHVFHQCQEMDVATMYVLQITIRLILFPELQFFHIIALA